MALIKRYPGVRPFETEDKDLFFGRDRDIADLHDLIALERLVVLFGKSGYGKSSLINAGLIPKLSSKISNDDDVPLFSLVVRLYTYDGGIASPIDKVLAQLATVAPISEEASFLDALLDEKTLWYHFKHRQTPKKQRFLLIFDQFEEFFTYPSEQQVAFKTQLAELLYQDTPQTIRVAAANLERDQRRFLAQALEIKVLFAIRADRMSQLDSMKDKLPAILQKRYELKGLTAEQAKESIRRPAEKNEANRYLSPKFDYSEAALNIMTQKLSETKGSQRSGIEAFQLQILCEYLEDKIIKDEIPNNWIEPTHFEADIARIYEGYYERLIKKIDISVQHVARLLVEEKLIFENENTGEARRLSVDSGVLQKESGVSQNLLNQLESNFLLRRESTSTGGFNYEVSHDTLIAPILKSKAERKTLEQTEAERLEAQRRRRGLLVSLSIILSVLTAVVGIGIYLYHTNIELNKALVETKNAKEEIQKTLNALRAEEKKREILEFSKDTLSIRGILKGGNCPENPQIEKLKNVQKKYSDDSTLQKQINLILKELESYNCIKE